MKIKGTKIILECLLEQGVDTVFGYPGGTILNLYDELYDYKDKITHILTAHEQGASHAADGYARSTGKVGVCFATSGPGATNLTTGIATAYMDSSPVVFITCNVVDPCIGTDAFQEVNITGISAPITKNSYFINHIDDLAPSIREAFTLAKSGRPGPVLLDVTKDVTAAMGEFTPMTKEEYIEELIKTDKVNRPVFRGIKHAELQDGIIDTVLELLEESQKPFVIAGGGIIKAGAEKELKEFVEKYDTPVCSTLMGLGGIDAHHPLFTGMIGMHGTQTSNQAVTNCDLIIGLGTRFNDRITCSSSVFGEKAKIIHVDIDEAEIDKNVQTDCSVVGDLKAVLTLLNQKMAEKSYCHEEWKKTVAAYQEKTVYNESKYLNPKEMIEFVEKETNGEAIIATDVGQHQMWAAQYYTYKRPKQSITSGGFGTMGFGLGAAIGSKIGNPEVPVVHITGDGSFRMNSNELATVSYYDIPIITIVFNNTVLGMVRQWQHLMYQERYSETTLDRAPDFVKLAEAYDIKGYRVDTMEAFKIAFREALESGKPALLDCKIDKDEMVNPMVAPGSNLTNFILD